MQSVSCIAEHSFIEAPLRSGDAVVVDLGCHQGGFASGMIKKYGARVYAVEPVPELFAALPRLPGLYAEQVAIVGRSAERVDLVLNEASCATVDGRLREPGATTVSVPAERLDRLLARHGLSHVDLLKLDIEGAELEVLDSAPASVLSTITQITVEFHDFAEPALRPQVTATHRRLVSLGFQCFPFSRGNQDVLYVNAAKLSLRLPDRKWIAIRYRYLRGAGRMLARWRTRPRGS